MQNSSLQYNPSQNSGEIAGHIVDLVSGKIFDGKVCYENGRITSLTSVSNLPAAAPFIAPPLVNSHVHVESSMLVPSQFGPPCLACGVGATVSDPHEIANVLGISGVEYMLEDAKRTALRIHFGAPSCVPATNSSFETAGDQITAAQIGELLERPEMHYLTEMMNFPGVLQGDREVLAKLAHAKRLGKPIDGHAPGLTGDAAMAYAAAGITTDHECTSLEEALFKITHCGMKILIREGSAAKNFEALIPLMREHPESLMFCSDDLHPDQLLMGNIDSLVRRAIAFGIPPLTALRAATLNPVRHYRLNLGLLQLGDRADFLLADSLQQFTVQSLYLDGVRVAHKGEAAVEAQRAAVRTSPPNRFLSRRINAEDLALPRNSSDVRVIDIRDGQLVTDAALIRWPNEESSLRSLPEQDIVKLVVVNRYEATPPAVALVRKSGFKRGAIASSVAHDCHNIVALGVTDQEIAAAINLVMESHGGIAISCGEYSAVLPLPVAGLMSTESASQVGQAYAALDAAAKERCGATLGAPFMTLSFLALLVIPALKLSDRGLFDGIKFQFVSVS